MNYDPIDTCPYDPAHRIMRSRMQYHLTKCSKNWLCSNKKTCPYDARHIVNQIEFNYHVSICPKRESVMHYKIVENEEMQHPKFLPIDSKSAAASTEENWEEDGKVQSYNPMKHSENRLVTRILIGAPKSERKRHRLQERLRISRLEDAPKVEKDIIQKYNNQHSIKSTIPEEGYAEAEQEYKPLRRPKKLPLETSKMSDFSTMNDSTIVNRTQNSVNQNESLQYIQEKANTKADLDRQTKTFSYAAAAAKNVPTNQHQQNCSIESDYDVVIESVKFDTEKENNSSFFNNTTIDENLIKVTKTVEALTIGDEGHKVQSESLDRTLESLKKKENYSSVTSNGLNKSDTFTTTEKRVSRCAANLYFTNTRQFKKK